MGNFREGIIMTVQRLASTEVRKKWPVILDATANGETDIVITRAGEPVTVMISYEDYLAILDELEDARLARRAASVLADLDAGKTTARPWDSIRADWITEGVERDG
jgi:prevent-host-death family protein